MTFLTNLRNKVTKTVAALVAVVGLGTAAQADNAAVCSLYKAKTIEYTKLIEDGKSNEIKRKYDKASLESYQDRYTKLCVQKTNEYSLR